MPHLKIFLSSAILVMVLLLTACEQRSALDIDAEDWNSICKLFVSSQDACEATLPTQQLIRARTEIPFKATWINARHASRNVEAIRKHGFRPHDNYPAWSIDLPIDWAADPFEDRNWRFQLHSWRLIDPFLGAYEQSGNRDHLDMAIAIILDWYHYHAGSDRTTKFSWHDMATGLRAMKLAYLLDILGTEVDTDGETRAAIIHLASMHAEKLSDPAYIVTGNHAYFQLHGLRILCAAASRLKTCHNSRDFVESHLTELLRKHFSQEGVYFEHSPSYHYFALNILSDLMNSGFYDDFTEFRSIFDRAVEINDWFVMPSRLIAPVGDSAGRTSTNGVRSGGEIHCTGLAGCAEFRSLDASGYAIARSGKNASLNNSWYLMFTAVYNSEHHKHGDDLSFVWESRGEILLGDAGKYAYKANANRSYVRRRFAHNSLVFVTKAGEVLDGFDTGVYGSGMTPVQPEPWGLRFHATAPLESFGVEISRSLHLQPGHWLVIYDWLDASNPDIDRSRRNFLLGRELQLIENDKVLRFSSNAQQLLVSFNDADTCTTDLARGERNPIRGWISTGYSEIKPTWSFFRECPLHIEEPMITILALSQDDLDDARQHVRKNPDPLS